MKARNNGNDCARAFYRRSIVPAFITGFDGGLPLFPGGDHGFQLCRFSRSLIVAFPGVILQVVEFPVARIDLGAVGFPIAVVPSGLAADVKTKWTRTCLHATFEQGDQADAIERAVVRHVDADDVKDGWKVIDSASGYVAAGPRFNFGRPLKQARDADATFVKTSLASFKLPLATGSLVVAFRTVVRAESDQRVVRDAVIPKTGAKLADCPVEGCDTAVVIEVLSVQLPVSIAIGVFFAGDDWEVRRVEPDNGEKGSFAMCIDEIKRVIHDQT